MSRPITDAEYWASKPPFCFICEGCGQANGVDTWGESWDCAACGWAIAEPEVDPRLSLVTARGKDLDRLVRVCGYMRRGNEEDDALRERVLGEIR